MPAAGAPARVYLVRRKAPRIAPAVRDAGAKASVRQIMAVVPAAVRAPSGAAIVPAVGAEAAVPATSPGAAGAAREIQALGGATEKDLLDGQTLAAVGGRAAPPEVAPSFPAASRGGRACTATAGTEVGNTVPETVAFLATPAGGVAVATRRVSELTLDPPETRVEVQAGGLPRPRIAAVATDEV